MVLKDSLVKAAAWTHNTNLNKLGYTPLQLVKGKSYVLLGLTMGNEATERLGYRGCAEHNGKIVEDSGRVQEGRDENEVEGLLWCESK